MPQPENLTSSTIAQRAKRKKSLFDWIFPPYLILFLITIFVPHGPVRSTLNAISAWLVLVIFIVMPLSPLWSFLKTIGLILTGRLHFPTRRIGEVVTDDEGRQFTIFREVVVTPSKGSHKHPGAVLTLRFEVTNMSPAVNRFYSILPLPLYIGDPGFRSKLFTIHGENCQSIYEWDTIQDAENYVHSIALKSILLRSVPGSFAYHIAPLEARVRI